MRQYYRVCPHCGATLDAGEICDCLDDEQLAEYILEKDEPVEEIAVCRECKSKRYCTALCRIAQDEIEDRRSVR